MVNPEGTYTIVRGQEFVDFYINLGKISGLGPRAKCLGPRAKCLGPRA
jgi:hypothetical protein